MGSLRIESQRRQHPRKSDLEIAEKLAREHGYIAVVRYKNSPTSEEYTDFGTCRTAEELHSYLRSTYCHNVEILFDGRDRAFSRRGGGSQADALPIITGEVLHETFVAYNEATLKGPGIKKLKETTEHWNKGRYGKAFKLLTKAVSLGLEARAEADARCLLGQIYIKRRQLEAAVSELIQCLKRRERTYADAWQAAQRLYYVYSEAGRHREANLLRVFAEKANRPLGWRHTAELEADVRNLTRLWLARVGDKQEEGTFSGWRRFVGRIRYKAQALDR